MEQPWVSKARQYVGVKEIKGINHNTIIVGWWKAIKRAGIKTDEVPWCAAFVGAMLEAVGLRSSRYESAKSYLDWGVSLSHPEPGCIVVFQRDGGGHVGFVVGRNALGQILVLGGNQNDEVNVRAFHTNRVVGYRWPAAVPVPHEELASSDAPPSGSEA